MNGPGKKVSTLLRRYHGPMGDFFQDPPSLANPFETDRQLRLYLGRFPADFQAAVTPGLRRLGERAAFEMPALAAAAEAEPPRHVPFDAWGRRIDTIEVSSAWTRLHAIAAEEGVVATAFEGREGAFSRVHQLLRLYLYHPSSAIASCPLAMTDGAAVGNPGSSLKAPRGRAGRSRGVGPGLRPSPCPSGHGPATQTGTPGDTFALALAEGFLPTLERAVQSLEALPPGVATILQPPMSLSAPEPPW